VTLSLYLKLMVYNIRSTYILLILKGFFYKLLYNMDLQQVLNTASILNIENSYIMEQVCV